MKWIKRIKCFLLGHSNVLLNGQAYEKIKIVKLDGEVKKECRLVEREWCGRCREKVSVSVLD